MDNSEKSLLIIVPGQRGGAQEMLRGVRTYWLHLEQRSGDQGVLRHWLVLVGRRGA